MIAPPTNLTTLDPNETTTVYSGTKSLKATYTAAWGGMYLHHDGVNTASSIRY